MKQQEIEKQREKEEEEKRQQENEEAEREEKKGQQERYRNEESERKKEREASAQQTKKTTALMVLMLARLENSNIPWSIDHLSKKSIHNVSGLTEESTQIVAVSPAVTNCTTTSRHHQELIISQFTEEEKPRDTKRSRLDNEAVSCIDRSGDGSGATMHITGSESQSKPVQHNPENGVESAQHHDHQTDQDRLIQ